MTLRISIPALLAYSDAVPFIPLRGDAVKFRYFFAALFFAVSAFAADRTSPVEPEIRQLNRMAQNPFHAGKGAPILVAQFASMTCTDGSEDYAPGDTLCRVHNLWECQKDGHWLDLKKKC